jgi:hypothetical protein
MYQTQQTAPKNTTGSSTEIEMCSCQYDDFCCCQCESTVSTLSGLAGKGEIGLAAPSIHGDECKVRETVILAEQGRRSCGRCPHMACENCFPDFLDVC